MRYRVSNFNPDDGSGFALATDPWNSRATIVVRQRDLISGKLAPGKLIECDIELGPAEKRYHGVKIRVLEETEYDRANRQQRTA
jgi:hypothetical protein